MNSRFCFEASRLTDAAPRNLSFSDRTSSSTSLNQISPTPSNLSQHVAVSPQITSKCGTVAKPPEEDSSQCSYITGTTPSTSPSTSGSKPAISLPPPGNPGSPQEGVLKRNSTCNAREHVASPSKEKHVAMSSRDTSQYDTMAIHPEEDCSQLSYITGIIPSTSPSTGTKPMHLATPTSLPQALSSPASPKGVLQRNSTGQARGQVASSSKEEGAPLSSRKQPSMAGSPREVEKSTLSELWGASALSYPFSATERHHWVISNIQERYQMAPDSKRKPRAIERLSRKADDMYDNVWEALGDEIMISGRLWFDYFTPAAPGTHNCYFTYFFVLACVSFFCFASGIYAYWMIRDGGFDPDEVFAMYSSQPVALSDWLLGGADEHFVFKYEFLKTWGGRYLPDVYKDQLYSRWFTSLFLHESNHHLWSNLFFFVILSGHLENKYGTVRISLIAIVSGIGGNFFSALLEDGCTMVLGSSGLIFGLFGVYIVDIILNFESVKRPLLQGSAIVVAVFYLVGTSAHAQEGHSHFSHIGGLICGMFPGFLFLPNFHKEDWEVAIPYLAFLGVVGSTIVLPISVYTQILPDLECAD